MNVPIFITGYERSGTTLLRRLVSMHPELRHDLVHEKPHLLMGAKSVEHAYQSMTYDTSSIRSGQKIPYVNGTPAKERIDKFFNLFPEGYLIHIIREPLEAINSQVKTFGRKAKHCIKLYFNSVPTVYNYTKNIPNSCQISYENLVTNPKEVLGSIYRWMGKEVDAEHIERVITTRDSWKHKGRDMPGLRYFDRIVPKERVIMLKKGHAEIIRHHPLMNFETDF